MMLFYTTAGVVRGVLMQVINLMRIVIKLIHYSGSLVSYIQITYLTNFKTFPLEKNVFIELNTNIRVYNSSNRDREF